jgi:uncharacterized phage protein (TIGR01671 family)
MKNNRIFRFRVWDKSNKQFCASIRSPLCLMDFTSNIYGDLMPCSPYNPDECVIQQCLGIRDKNNQEIYEGDIVKIKETTGFILWDNNRVGFVLSRIDGQSSQVFLSSLLCGNSIPVVVEVIGNVFENSNLIK